jgi:hypothetical protein
VLQSTYIRRVPPPAKKAGGTHSPGGEGGGGQYFGRRQPRDWPLTIISLRDVRSSEALEDRQRGA